MKTRSTVTSKGQITIPRSLRRLLGVRAGDALEFEVRHGKVEVRPARPSRISAGVLKPHLPKGWRAPTVAQIEAGIVRHFKGKHRAA